MRIAILTPPRPADGRPDLDDTFVQAGEIGTALTALGHHAVAIIWEERRDVTREALRTAGADLVFNLVEDVREGPDQVHRVTALLDEIGLRYTGAPTAALEALGDKATMKAALRSAGLPVPTELEDASAHARFIVKSRIEHASIGLTDENVVVGASAATALVARNTAEQGGSWLAEVFVDGREFNVALLETETGPVVLPPSEILFIAHDDGRPRIVGYPEKWDVDGERYATTPRETSVDPADAALRTELARLSLAAWDAFALRGYARVDFRVDLNGKPVILEVNANPCLAADAGFCAAAAAMGLTQIDVVRILLAAAQI